MQWFSIWWEGLSTIQQVFACVAIPATVILILQTILLLIGIGGHDADHGEIDDHSALDAHGMDVDGDHDAALDDWDADHDFDHDTDLDSHDGAHHGAGVRLFTIRGLVAFFAVGGWLGIVLMDVGISAAVSVLIALIGGLAALLLVAVIIKWSLSMQETGNLTLKNAIAHTATVYIAIPPSRTGTGKVMLTLQEQYVELEAVTDYEQKILSGSQVQVTSIMNDHTLVVTPVVKIPNSKIIETESR